MLDYLHIYTSTKIISWQIKNLSFIYIIFYKIKELVSIFLHKRLDLLSNIIFFPSSIQGVLGIQSSSAEFFPTPIEKRAFSTTGPI